MLRSVFSKSPAPKNEITTLTYRGVTYKVPENRTQPLGYAFHSLITLMREELIYRGVKYKLTSAYPKIHPSNLGKQLIYRGVAYEIAAV